MEKQLMGQVKKEYLRGNIWLTCLLGFVIKLFWELKVDYLLLICVVILYALTCYYIEPFLKVRKKGLMNQIGMGDLEEVVRYHAFDVDGYFRLIQKKMLWWQMFLSLIVILWTILSFQAPLAETNWLEKVLAFAYIWLVPWVTLLIRKKIFNLKCKNRNHKLGGLIVYYVLHGVLLGGGIIVSMLLTLMGLFIFIAVMPRMIGGAFVPDQSKLYFIAWHNSLFLIAAIFLIVAFLILPLVFQRNQVLSGIRIGLFALLMIVLVIGGYWGKQNYNMISEDDNGKVISVVQRGQKKDYRYEEVTDFTVYATTDAMQMELTFYDGETMKVFGDNCENSDYYADLFYSDYNFAAYLIRQFLDAGATGKLIDQDKLEAFMKTLDPQCYDGLKEMEALLSS